MDSNDSYGRNYKKINSGAGYPRLEVKTASIELGSQHVICDDDEVDEESRDDEVIIGDSRERVKRPSISSLKKAKYSRSLYSTGSANQQKIMRALKKVMHLPKSGGVMPAAI